MKVEFGGGGVSVKVEFGGGGGGGVSTLDFGLAAPRARLIPAVDFLPRKASFLVCALLIDNQTFEFSYPCFTSQLLSPSSHVHGLSD